LRAIAPWLEFRTPLQGLRSSSFYLGRCPRLPSGAPLGLLTVLKDRPLLISRRAPAEFQRSSRQFLPEQPKQSQIWSHLRPERRYPEQFLLIFTALPKGSEGSRRTECDGYPEMLRPDGRSMRTGAFPDSSLPSFRLPPCLYRCRIAAQYIKATSFVRNPPSPAAL